MSTMPAQSGKGSPARHMCHCGKGFLRKEHLRRHQATHAQPSFVCPICDRSFTRNDVLKRHVAVHESTHVSSTRNWRACDACHENKTRCGGGDQCALCTKRGISCTYSRDAGAKEVEEHPIPDAVTSAGPANVTAEPMQAESLPTASSSTSGPLPEAPVTQNGQERSDIQVAHMGLTCVMDAISAAISGRQTAAKLMEHTKEWLPTCVRTYFGSFHERWPIIHAPVFDEKTDNALVVGTVLMIASWQRDDDSLRDTTVSIHDRLASHLLKTLAEPVEELSAEKPWPYETYQITLLNVIFAFETGRSTLIPRARRLLSLLITALRESHVFCPDAVEKHESTHFPGTFPPWIHQNRARWKWMTVNALKVDVYMALICNQPPLIQAEELELGLTSTFSLFNAYGIDKFFMREREESTDRAKCPMAEMARSPQTLLPSGTLVEDVTLGFLGTYPGIWRWAQTRKSKSIGAQVDPDQGDAVFRQLETWKIRLDGISNLWTEPQSNASAINYLLRAYRGEEETSDAGWERPVLTRIAIRVLNTTILYHLLGLHLSADIRSMSVMMLGSWSMGGGSAATADAAMTGAMRQWAASQEARRALIHSLNILKAYENALATMNSPCQSLDPIAQVALSTAAMAVRCWFLSGGVPCGCDAASGGQLFSNLDINAIPDKDEWVQDGGSIAVDGVALCQCSSSAWMTRFVLALSRGGILWEMNGSIANALQITLHSD